MKSTADFEQASFNILIQLSNRKLYVIPIHQLWFIILSSTKKK